jgi:sortase A
MENFSWKKAILLCLAVGLLAAGLSVFLQVNIVNLRNFITANAGSAAAFEAPAKPARLIIPAIDVNAPVESVGLFWNGDGDMSIPSNFTDVAWYNGGPRPGMPGSAVIDGHLDGRNVKEAVFYNLGNLKPGDAVDVVDQNGRIWQFQVIRVTAYDYDASTTDIFSSNDSAARLNLITCAGDWLKGQGLYNKRLVVFTKLVTPTNST